MLNTVFRDALKPEETATCWILNKKENVSNVNVWWLLVEKSTMLHFAKRSWAHSYIW